MRRKETPAWFPVYIDKWIFGSTRHELTFTENGHWVDLRGIFWDLVTLSKKDGGFIRANEAMPYPVEQLAGLFHVPIDRLRQCIELCLKYEKIRETSPGIYFVTGTEEYSLTDRHQRRLAWNEPSLDAGSANSDVMSDNADTRREEKKGKEKKGKEKRIKGVIIFNHETKEWEGIGEEDVQDWEAAFPAVDIGIELKRMRLWIMEAGAKGRKIQWRAFILRWLAKTQDRGGNGKVDPKRPVSQVGKSTRAMTEEEKKFREEFIKERNRLLKDGIKGWALEKALADFSQKNLNKGGQGC